MEQDKNATLQKLRDMGVLHLVPVLKPEGEHLEKTRRELASAEFVLNSMILRPGSKQKKPGTSPKHIVTGEEAVSQVQKLLSQKKELTHRIESLNAEKELLEPLGDFEPQIIEDLRRKGVNIRLFSCRKDKLPAPAESYMGFVVGEKEKVVFIAMIGEPPANFEGKEIYLPPYSLSEVIARLREAEEQLKNIEESLDELQFTLPAIKKYTIVLREKVRFLEADASMGKSGIVTYLQGFCPEDKVQSVVESARVNGWGILVSDPEEGDVVPTLIKNPRWIRPIQALFDLMQILPGYREVDVSAVFLIFFSIFFAMIIGDAGYGLLFLGITLLLRKKFPRAPSEPFNLMKLFSVCTIIWGILTGMYFGITVLPGPLARLRIDWLSDNQNMMILCLYIGAIHLTVAHMWNFIRMFHSRTAYAQLGWAGVVWGLFFIANSLLFDKPLYSWYVVLTVAGGLAGVLLSMPPGKKEWVNVAILPLTIMSNFGDILSYLRLWALGIASMKLAGAFNEMVVKMIGFSDPLRMFGSALILFIGHALNIGLGCLSVLVHGVRLNALEFSTHFGLEWTGIPYRPFAKEITAEENHNT
jgi:V/A-type H+-transporting ATPase subunit I